MGMAWRRRSRITRTAWLPLKAYVRWPYSSGASRETMMSTRLAGSPFLRAPDFLTYSR
jgi:hypothetical protein